MGSVNLFDTELRQRAIERVVYVYDYLQIEFSDDICLTINNKYSSIGGELKDFIGATVEKTEANADAFTIFFEANRQLSVGLADEDYYCPEAMVLHGGKYGTIVWQ